MSSNGRVSRGTYARPGRRPRCSSRPRRRHRRFRASCRARGGRRSNGNRWRLACFPLWATRRIFPSVHRAPHVRTATHGYIKPGRVGRPPVGLLPRGRATYRMSTAGRRRRRRRHRPHPDIAAHCSHHRQCLYCRRCVSLGSRSVAFGRRSRGRRGPSAPQNLLHRRR